METHVELLGGFPLIVKILGSEGGNGVIRVDSHASLFSLLDYVGSAPILMECFEHVVYCRLIVIGNNIAASEARHFGPGDFRTNSIGSDLIGAAAAPPAAIEMALKLREYCGLSLAGRYSGESGSKLLLAELNFSCRFSCYFCCYFCCCFADQQRDSGINIAGAMLNYLMAKSRRINPNTTLV